MDDDRLIAVAAHCHVTICREDEPAFDNEKWSASCEACVFGGLGATPLEAWEALIWLMS